MAATHRSRRPMYPQPWQRWAWAAVPAVSAAGLAFVPFVVAWRRKVVGWRTLAVYTTLSGALIIGAVAEVDIHQWGAPWREVIRYADWAYLIIAVIHVAFLDWPRKKGYETIKA